MTPTDRFVEALQSIPCQYEGDTGQCPSGSTRWCVVCRGKRQAVEAFADEGAHTRENCCNDSEWCWEFDSEVAFEKQRVQDRTALLKRVMG